MYDMGMKPVMDEGPQAFERFRKAVKTILSVPKSALLPDPFKSRTNKKKPVKG